MDNKGYGKGKRIRNNATVQIAPSTRLGRPLGPIATASARILSVTEQTEAQRVTDRQFGWLKKFFGLHPLALRSWRGGSPRS